MMILCTFANIFFWINLNLYYYKVMFLGYQPAIDYCKEYGYK